METDRKDITKKVREFYETLPFNFRASSDKNIELIKKKNQIEFYSDFHSILKKYKDETVLDVGCGVGWFINSVAYHYPLTALGIDISLNALRRAGEISKKLGIGYKVKYINCDLFNINFTCKFLLVNSIGVLHHTFNLKTAIESVADLVKEDGFLHIGLYHKFGRRPFLDLFQRYRNKISKENALNNDELTKAYALFKQLNSNIQDEVFLNSWFRDQVLHPHETQHTFEETACILSSLGFKIVSTSINKFKPISDLNDIFKEEKKYYNISIKKNINSKMYFPGFFTVLARKCHDLKG